MHHHIYTFCGESGCKNTDYHPNTEDLVSPALSGDEVATCFRDWADMGMGDDIAVLPCHEKPCVNPRVMWVYVMRGDPLMLTFRPNHWRPDVAPQGPPTMWAQAHSIIHPNQAKEIYENAARKEADL